MSKIVNWLCNNAFQVDAAEAEKHVREKYPLLLHKKETIELAFHKSADRRDKSYFTSERILIQDGKGIGSKRYNYASIPYWSIKAFAIATAGKLDTDVELKIYGKACIYHSISFAAGSVDIFSVMQFMNMKVNWIKPLSSESQVDGTPSPAFDKESAFGKLVDRLGDNAKQLVPAEVEQTLKVDSPVLSLDEKVEMAFKAGRDTVVFTDKRCLFIDVQGVVGKKIEFASYPWSSFSAFAVETAGAYFDRDSEMKLFTNIISIRELGLDFRKQSVDLMAIQKHLANKILGEDTAPIPDVDHREGHLDDAKSSVWFKSDQRPLDAAEMSRYYHNEIPILQGAEQIEFAFKGRRDITLFTTKRIIEIDPKGWKGVKIEYTSIPWKSVLSFGVKTAGKHFDRDAEVMFWTDMGYVTRGEGEGEEPDPGLSYVEFDFNKDMVDVLVLKKYLSARLLGKKENVMIQPSTYMTSSEESGIEKFFSKLGDDQRAVDPTELNKDLHTDVKILLDDESIIMAFKCGRDITLFTNYRAMVLDTQGWSGKKVAYLSFPYEAVRGFSVESAGSWDRDSELDIYSRNLWDPKWSFDFRKGKVDIISIQKFIAAIVIGRPEEAARYLSSTDSPLKVATPSVTITNFVAWATDSAKEIDPEQVDQQLHSEPSILLDDEAVERAYKSGRDMYIYTTHRILKIDVQGLRGTKVEYLSLPLKWAVGFEIETAGNLDPDAESYVYFDIPEHSRFMQSILVKRGDIMEKQQYLTDTILYGRFRK